jgi:NAD-dependent dihydropyrimidine dehydrogenase PreA subunit
MVLTAPKYRHLTGKSSTSNDLVHDANAGHAIMKINFPMAYVIAEPCIGTKDAACIDACPVDCIHPKKDEPGFAEHNMIYIDPVECIDCGACVPVCPVSAIFALDDLPEKWSEFAQKNSEYFGR